MASREEVLDRVQNEAEEIFSREELYCSEAVVKTINSLLDSPYDEEVIKLASGFPVGMGMRGCLCGAVSGGQMSLGMVYGRKHGENMDNKMFEVSAGLHDYIKEDYGSTCCRVITRQWAGDNFASEGRKRHCIEITGKVARWVADQMIEDGYVKID
ncbi:MAG: C-GCAxxG-C-C family protein [Andreesenia angusta]|nr:C-GCAxxG-C-C family protein [Andreesenia angusta]